MWQLRFDQTEDHKNDRRRDDQVVVDLVAISPDFFCEGRQFDRPGQKAGEDRYEIKGEEKQINAERIGAVTFHHAKRSTDHVRPSSNSEKSASDLVKCLDT